MKELKQIFPRHGLQVDPTSGPHKWTPLAKIVRQTSNDSKFSGLGGLTSLTQRHCRTGLQGSGLGGRFGADSRSGSGKIALRKTGVAADASETTWFSQ